VAEQSRSGRKRTSLNSVKVLKICTQVNEELNQRQKFVVLVHLLEFISANDEVSEQEADFVSHGRRDLQHRTRGFQALPSFRRG
jgi:hypothetical protein